MAGLLREPLRRRRRWGGTGQDWDGEERLVRCGRLQRSGRGVWRAQKRVDSRGWGRRRARVAAVGGDVTFAKGENCATGRMCGGLRG